MREKSSLPTLIARSGLINSDSYAIEFNDEVSTLDRNCIALETLTDSAICSNDKEIVDALNELDDLEADVLHNEIYTKDYQDIADRIAMDINTSLENLNAVTKQVKALVKSHNEIVNSLTKVNPVLDVLSNEENNAEVAIETLDWAGLEGVSSFIVRAKVNNTIGAEPTAKADHLMYDRLLNNLPYSHKYNSPEIEKLELSEEAYARIVDAVNKNTDLGETISKQVVNSLCNFNRQYCFAAKRFCNDLIHHNFADSSIKTALEMIRVWSRAIPVLASQELLDVSNTTMNTINKHVGMISSIIDLVAYATIDIRENFWNKSVLLPGNMINKDTYSYFTENGGDKTMIAKFANYEYKDIAIPTAGVEGEQIINSIKRISEQVDKEIEEKKINVKKELKKVQDQAFVLVSNKWAKENKECFKRMDQEDVDKFCRMVGNQNISTEDKFYQLILNSKFRGTDTQDLYNALSNEYTEHMKMYSELKEEDIARLDTRVFARIASNKLFESGLIKLA